MNERVTIWGQKIKSQGYSGIKYAGNSTFWACINDVLKSISHIFCQTYTNDVLWDRDKYIKFWGRKVKVQGDGGITFAGTVTAQAEAMSRVKLDFLVHGLICLIFDNFVTQHVPLITLASVHCFPLNSGGS